MPQARRFQRVMRARIRAPALIIRVHGELVVLDRLHLGFYRLFMLPAVLLGIRPFAERPRRGAITTDGLGSVAFSFLFWLGNWRQLPDEEAVKLTATTVTGHGYSLAFQRAVHGRCIILVRLHRLL